ncbi:MAG: signal peptidase I [Agathobacter sp.]|nr:signal peptidase I [Agathobacter sp.]
MRRRSGLNFGKQRKKFNLPLFKEILTWIGEILLIIVVAGICVSFFGVRTTVVGQAMSETLSNGDQILINKFQYVISSPKQGDVVVFLPNGNEKSHYYVRRVIGVPGDTIQIKEGAVYVNDELYLEEREVASIEEAGIASEPITLEDGEYFVLGDNRNNSEDSRFANIGNIKEDYIIGKAWVYFESIGKMGFIK